MRGGFVLEFVIFGLLLIFGYWVYITYSQTSSAKTKSTAASIFHYPSATSWLVKEGRNVCLLQKNCVQSTNVLFSSSDTWNSVYNYYKKQMLESGWQTNSNIYTSIPDGAVYTNSQNCEAYLTKDSFGYFWILKQDNGKFKFVVKCND